MPNSKFFIGSYSGDVSTRNANYSSCDWASSVSASYQPQPVNTVASSPCQYSDPTNPYTFAKQPDAVSSAYYAPLPVASPCGCVEEPVVVECPPVPACPSVPSTGCGCHHNEPVMPECPVYPEHPECPSKPTPPHNGCGCHCDEPVVPEYPDCTPAPECPVYPECPTVPECPAVPPFVPEYPDCNCPTTPEPDPCATAATGRDIPAQAMPYANMRPRRRNRLNVQANVETRFAQAQTSCGCTQEQPADPCVRPMPKRKHRGCNCVPQTPAQHCATPVQQGCQTGQSGRYIETTDEDDCRKQKREKCFLYEKLKHYRRKGKTLCEFLEDYDEETFYDIIYD